MAVTPSGPEPPPSTSSPSLPAAEVVSLRAPAPPADTAPVSASDLAEATRTVLAVAGALGRYVVEVRARAPLSAARSLRPAPRRLARAVLGRGARMVTSAGQTLAEVAGGMADVLLPTVAREALSRVDVTALVLEFVDLDRLAAALDVDSVVARVDVESIAAGLDLDALVEKVDIDRILERVDLDDVVARVDLDRAVDRVDIARVLDRVDLDGVVDRVDIDRIIARADLLQLVRWVVEEIDLPELIRSSSGSVAAEMSRGVREQSADADRAVERVVDRLLRRRGERS